MLLVDKETLPLPDLPPPAISDKPPPYVRAGAYSGSPRPSRVEIPEATAPSQSLNIPRGVQARPAVSTRTRYQDITGVYCIDPSLKDQAFEIPPHECHKRKGKIRARIPPHASFYSKSGTIKLSLAASGSREKSKPVRIRAGTSTGNVVITLFSTQNPRPINLYANSRHGSITVLVSPVFCGAISLRSHRGKVTFLPSFARSMRILKANEGEALALFGSSGPSEYPPTPSGEYNSADYCELTSRFGDVTVGLMGEDQYADPAPGFWKKIGSFFSGKE